MPLLTRYDVHMQMCMLPSAVFIGTRERESLRVSGNLSISFCFTELRMVTARMV